MDATKSVIKISSNALKSNTLLYRNIVEKKNKEECAKKDKVKFFCFFIKLKKKALKQLTSIKAQVEEQRDLKKKILACFSLAN